MKTQELIKQAEKLLKVHDTAFTNERDMFIIATFSRNHMQEIIDKLKQYEKALIPFVADEAPCMICGYNGPNYYQPSVHKCSEFLHGVGFPKMHAREVLRDT